MKELNAVKIQLCKTMRNLMFCLNIFVWNQVFVEFLQHLINWILRGNYKASLISVVNTEHGGMFFITKSFILDYWLATKHLLKVSNEGTTRTSSDVVILSLSEILNRHFAVIFCPCSRKCETEHARGQKFCWNHRMLEILEVEKTQKF